MANRGPDDEGHWVDHNAGIALGHRRLSIIDLSPAGHQPMLSDSGRYVLVYNGEIYNHLEIRAEIEARSTSPRVWRGSSDTESLLAGIEMWGMANTLRRCVGMFAIGLWDRQDRVLTLARDRLGEKPLYYGKWANSFVFASELDGLRAIPGFSPTVNRTALLHYFSQKAVPAPFSIYDGIHKLEPGQMLTLAVEYPSFDDVQPRPYWSLHDAIDAPRFEGGPGEAVAELKRLLLQSVSLQMVADVPVGAFLSGGVDSSAVVALMQSVSFRKVQTYSIGFAEAGFNEAPHAAAVARHLGTQHLELTVTAADALEIIPHLADIWDEPFADSSQIPTAILSALTRKEVKVALSGDGGDELFCGYKRQLTASTIERLPGKALLNGVLLAFGSHAGQMMLRSMPVGHGPKAVANRLGILSGLLAYEDRAERYRALAFQPHHWAVLLNNPGGYGTETGQRLPAGDDMLSIASAFDTLTYLPDDILTKVDRASMAVSLETRIPLLDHRIVDFAFSLPSDFKVREGRTKWPLRQVLDQYVPRALIDRPKMGFAVPIGEWLRGPLKAWAEALLFGQALQDEYLNPAVLQRIWRDHLAGRWDYSDHLWRVLMFRAWQARHG